MISGAHGSVLFRREESSKTTFTHDPSGRLQIPIKDHPSEWPPIKNAVDSFNTSEEGPRLNALSAQIKNVRPLPKKNVREGGCVIHKSTAPIAPRLCALCGGCGACG